MRSKLLFSGVVLILLASCGGSSSSGDSGSGGGGGGGGGGTPPGAGTDVVTYKNDNARTGQNLTETVLTPTGVTAANFGKLRTLATDGKVDAQPLYLSQLTIQGAAHNVAFIATENDTVYAFDADTGTILWQVSLLPSGEVPSDPVNCSQVTPTIGVTSTPVIDRSAATIYLVAMSKTSTVPATYHQRLHALNITTGAEQSGAPVEIAATYPTASGTLTFDPQQYEERAALLLSQGTLYTSWTSHCDAPPYSGWVMAYNQTTLAQTAVFNAAPNSGGSGPAIWMSGGGLASDSSGDVFLLTANGAFETTLDGNGFPNRADFGNSFLRLAGGALTAVDYFSMSNTVAESNADVDLGSGGILLLPDMSDSAGTVRHLAVGAGKDTNIYVVDRDAMGKFSASANNIWQELPDALSGGIWSTPAYYNSTIYYGPVGGPLKAFSISGAKLAAASSTAATFGYPGTSPSVSANQATNGIVWAYANDQSAAVLYAYDAADLSHELYNSAQAANGRDTPGPGNKFIAPMIADGKVFVATQTGVTVFGMLN